jgi:hypothetical protein
MASRWVTFTSATRVSFTSALTTRFELASRRTSELHALHREALQAFAAAARGTQERRDVLTSLTNLEAEIRSRPEP